MFPLHPDSIGGSSTQVLRQNCKAAAAHFLPPCPWSSLQQVQQGPEVHSAQPDQQDTIMCKLTPNHIPWSLSQWEQWGAVAYMHWDALLRPHSGHGQPEQQGTPLQTRAPGCPT